MSRIVGRGWATVDLDRAAEELAELVGPRGAYVEAQRSDLLGARCRRGRARTDDDVDAVWIVLLEPDTEGRLAGYLARFGEGWAATWRASSAAAERAGTPGPLGDERSADPSGVAGPFQLLLSTATIDP